MIDARPQTGTAPDEQTEMRYPTLASELDHRRLQVPPSLLHDSSTNQLHAGAWRTSQSCVRCLTKDIRETGAAKWAYVFTPHDQWDYDGVNENVLVDLPVNGQTRKALVHF